MNTGRDFSPSPGPELGHTEQEPLVIVNYTEKWSAPLPRSRVKLPAWQKPDFVGLKSLTLIGVLSREKTSNLKVNSFKILQLHEKQFFFCNNRPMVGSWKTITKTDI